MTTQEKSQATTPAYKAPKLTVHGTVVELTAGGSGNRQEAGGRRTTRFP